MKRTARMDASAMSIKALSLRCEPVPRALTDTGRDDQAEPATPKRAGRKGGEGRAQVRGKTHDHDNARVYLTGLSIEHKQLDKVRARFAPNADPADGAHAIRCPVNPALYRANCHNARALTHVRTAPRRRYPPELLNTRGYLIGTEADETHARLSWLYREGLISRNPVSGPAPDWRAAAKDISREELRAALQPEIKSDMTPTELALERAADELLMRGGGSQR